MPGGPICCSRHKRRGGSAPPRHGTRAAMTPSPACREHRGWPIVLICKRSTHSVRAAAPCRDAGAAIPSLGCRGVEGRGQESFGLIAPGPQQRLREEVLRIGQAW